MATWGDEEMAMVLYAYSVEHLSQNLDSELLAAIARNPVHHWHFKLPVEDRATYRAAWERIKRRMRQDEPTPIEAGLCGES